VIQPVILGETSLLTATGDDIRYAEDLGLIRQTETGVEIANPIYQEVIPRLLTAVTEINLGATSKPSAWYVHEGRLDMHKLLAAFQQFFRENSEHWVERFEYKEAGPQLLLQAFLHRIVNGGGRIDREYGLGRGRTDLMVFWGDQREVLELKVAKDAVGTAKAVTEGVGQISGYMDRAGVNEGHLIVFERGNRSWDEKIFHREESSGGRRIQVWGM